MKRWIAHACSFSCIGLLLNLIVPSVQAQTEEERYFHINKGIELFGTIYKEIMINYVDEIDPTTMMEAGIRGMLTSLDPYTIFIDENNKSDVDMLTKGKYGGIGITVGLRDGILTITGVMEGYSAEREGLRIGDQILQVDGHPVYRMRPEKVRHYMRGAPGSPVRLRLVRPARIDTIDVTVTREEISLKNVSFDEMIDGEIGLIKLERFGRSAGEDVREILKRFKTHPSIKGIILDVRDNPGGLLDAAVAVVENFIGRGSLIVSTRGRKANAQRDYWTEEEPILPSIPLVIIMNKASASASEIVAGAVQDLDRGVLVGTRTFGKGLVQNVIPLSFNTSLKLTTARYYTPSGRCIQEIDYTNTDSSAASHPKDSTRKIYRTLHHKRVVFEAGGIAPDTILDMPTPPSYITDLKNNGLLFEYVTRLTNGENPTSSGSIDEEIMNNFKNYLDTQTAWRSRRPISVLEELHGWINKEQYDSSILIMLDELREKIRTEQESDFTRNREEIRRQLEVEFAGRLKGETGKIKARYRYDNQLSAAIQIIKNRSMYERLLRKPH